MANDEILTGHFTRRHFIKGMGALTVLAGAGGVLAACGGDDSSGTTEETTDTTAAAVVGGLLRVGVVGGANDIMDAQYIVAKADQARLVTAFETLLTFNENFEPITDHGLAASTETIDESTYRVTLREGVTFHDGSPLTAAAVVYSFGRLIDESQTTAGGPIRTFLDANSVTAVDDLTVEFKLIKPNVEFLNALATYTFTIVPEGYVGGGAEAQIGTGPFTCVSFEPGRESVHKKYEGYWDAGYPVFDELRIISFADKAALVNALIAGQIDAAVDVPFEQYDVLSGTEGITVNETSSGGWLAMCMRVDTAPFDKVEVRQAMRLIVNRAEMVEQVLSGHGQIANDLFGLVDPFYNANEFPQREQDIEAAVALLESVGYTADNPLTVELFAPDDTAGLVGIAQAFGEQAKLTNGVVVVDVKITEGGTYWAEDGQYMNAPFHTTYWSGRAYLAQAAASMDAYPETKFPPEGSNYRDLYLQASATIDPEERKAICAEMQKLEFEEGGYIIPFFNNFADAYVSKMQGVVNRPGQLNLDYYGRGFKLFSFSA